MENSNFVKDINDIKISECGIDAVLDSTFRVRNKRLFLTYACKLDKNEFFNWFIINVGEVKYYKISHETYKELDENGYEVYHTHFLLEFNNKPDIKNVNAFDYLGNHPNIKRVASTLHFANAINYLDKEDESPFTNIKINDFDANQVLNDLYNKIQSHTKWIDVINDSSIRKQVCTKMNWCKEVFLAKPPVKIKSKLKFQQLMPWQKDLYKKLKGEPVDREIIWCWSDKPKTGKSMFKQFLKSKLNVLCIDYQSNKIGMNDIVNVYNNEDVIIFDLPWVKSKSLQRRLEASSENGDEMISNTFLDTLENLSNKGCEFTSVKYMGKKTSICAHILVLSNCNSKHVKEVLPERIHETIAKLEIPR